jgi:hypothetical protein
MNPDDAQTLRDIKHFTRELLTYADLLPPDLAAMLRDYESDLHSSPSDRWDGIGSPVQYDNLAHRIGQGITDGECPEGKRMDSYPGNWYTWAQRHDNVEKALQLLAARGELTPRCGTFYVGPHDEDP